MEVTAGWQNILRSIISVCQADMEKDTIFTPTSFVPKLFYPKKCVNQTKVNSQQNSVKGPTDPESAKKCQKVT